MSVYGVVIIECHGQPNLVGRFYWNGKDRVYHWSTLQGARDNAKSAGGTKYAPVLITPTLCKLLRTNPRYRYYGTVIE